MLINTNLYNESTEDNVFSYINQINNNYNAIIEAARISELRYYNDTGKELFINETNILVSLIHRIVEFFKSIFNKIASLFSKSKTVTSVKVKAAEAQATKIGNEIKNKRKLKVAPSSGSYKGNTSFSKKPKTKSSSSTSEPKNLVIDDNISNNDPFYEAEPVEDFPYSQQTQPKEEPKTQTKVTFTEPKAPENTIKLISVDEDNESITLTGTTSVLDLIHNTNANYNAIYKNSDIIEDYMDMYDEIYTLTNNNYTKIEDISLTNNKELDQLINIIKNKGNVDNNYINNTTIKIFKSIFNEACYRALKLDLQQCKDCNDISNIIVNWMGISEDEEEWEEEDIDELLNFTNKHVFSIYIDKIFKETQEFQKDIKDVIGRLEKLEKDIKSGAYQDSDGNIIKMINIITAIQKNICNILMVYYATYMQQVTVASQQAKIILNLYADAF